MLEFSSILKDGSDIHRFSNRKWVLNHVQMNGPEIPF